MVVQHSTSFGIRHLCRMGTVQIPLALRIQTSPDRVGLMVETSHLQNRIVGEIPFLGHTLAPLRLALFP